MEEHYEVPPSSQRVVWLNGQHMKPMLAFESLTRALGWGYNHHKPQVVWQQDCSVRLEVPKVRRVRGHTSHAHPQTTPTAVNTHVQMGTYLTFFLERRSSIQKCCLVLDGLEAVRQRDGVKVPGTDNSQHNRIVITRLADDGHTLDYPKGVAHDETQTSPVGVSSKIPTTLGIGEKLSSSPSKLNVSSKISSTGTPGKLSRTNKASKTSRSCSKRKRNLKLTPARNSVDDTLRNNATLRPGAATTVAGQDNDTVLDTQDAAEQNHRLNHSLSPPSNVDDVGQLPGRLNRKVNIGNEHGSLHRQNGATCRTESGTGSNESHETLNNRIVNKVEEAPACNNEPEGTNESSRDHVSDENVSDETLLPETKKQTEHRHHRKHGLEHRGGLSNGHDSNKAACRPPTAFPIRSPSPGGPYRDNVGLSDVWSLEADLSWPDEVTAILSASDSDGNDEWEDEDDEDIYKVVRKCISADITALLHQPPTASPGEAVNRTTHLSRDRLGCNNSMCGGNIDQFNKSSSSTNIDSPDFGSPCLKVKDMGTPSMQRDKGRNEASAEDHRNSKDGAVCVAGPRNRSVSTAGVATHGASSQEEQKRRGSLDPELLMTDGHRIKELRIIEDGKVALTDKGQETLEATGQNGDKERINCENMIRSFEHKIRLSKLNSNQHARANHLIEEIIEHRWNETKLRKTSQDLLNKNPRISKESLGSPGNDHSKLLDNTPLVTGKTFTTAVDPVNSDSAKTATSTTNSGCSKESLFLNGGQQGYPSTNIASPSPSLMGGSTVTLDLECDGASGTPFPEHEHGELLVLLLRPRTPQQAWQFQSAHLTVWYKTKDKEQHSNERGARRPPRRTRLTYRTETRPYTTRGLTAAVAS